MTLRKDGRSIEVVFVRADLAAELESVLDAPCDAVTAAAFFDLVSEGFIERFVAALAARALPLYTILTYDGRETWSPPHAADADMLAAFHAHQATDKGFGPAAGPNAAARMGEVLRRQAYLVTTGESPWRLDARDQALKDELARGIAQAAGETGRIPAARIADWLDAKLRADTCEIGHLDFYARPGR